MHVKWNMRFAGERYVFAARRNAAVGTVFIASAEPYHPRWMVCLTGSMGCGVAGRPPLEDFRFVDGLPNRVDGLRRTR